MRRRENRNPTSARLLCVSRARYATEDAAKESLAKLERTKVNPGALAVFPCASCDGFHLGTAFGPRPKTRHEVE